MLQQQWENVGEAALPAVAGHILSKAGQRRIFALYGDLGAGKTTLVKAFCKQLHLPQRVLSPTFTIIHEYGDPSVVYHIDLYRLNTLEEAYAAGVDECLASGRYCFIEWPQVLEPILPADTVRIVLEIDTAATRRIAVSSLR